MLKQEKEAVLIKDAIPKEQDRKSFFFLKNTTTKLETVVALVLSIISKEDETDLSVEPKAVNKINTQVIIVSHWITVLDVLKRKLGDQSKLISKEILPLKRTEIIESFNEKRSNIRVIMCFPLHILMLYNNCIPNTKSFIMQFRFC